MKYIANPVEVDAYQILEVLTLEGNVFGGTALALRLSEPYGGNWQYRPTGEMMARMVPKVGDYVVVQSDDYVYLNPKEVFERKYSPKSLDALELGAAARRAGIA